MYVKKLLSLFSLRGEVFIKLMLLEVSEYLLFFLVIYLKCEQFDGIVFQVSHHKFMKNTT